MSSTKRGHMRDYNRHITAAEKCLDLIGDFTEADEHKQLDIIVKTKKGTRRNWEAYRKFKGDHYKPSSYR